MAEFIIRPWQTSDLPAMENLWNQAFGDDSDYLQVFQKTFLHPGSCLIAEAGGKPVSAMYILEGPMLFPPDGHSLTTAYTYALATDPAFRRQGIGSAVYKSCVQQALQTVDAACVLPAGPDLYPFYQKTGGCVPVSWAREAVLTREELGSSRRRADRITPGEYYLRRKSLLRGYPYAMTTGNFLAMQAYHIRRFGGGFLSLDGDVAAVEMAGDTCRILELLAPEGDWYLSLPAVAELFPAEHYEIRSPVFFPGPEQVRPFMMATLDGPPLDKSAKDLWWGFAFD